MGRNLELALEENKCRLRGRRDEVHFSKVAAVLCARERIAIPLYMLETSTIDLEKELAPKEVNKAAHCGLKLKTHPPVPAVGSSTCARRHRNAAEPIRTMSARPARSNVPSTPPGESGADYCGV